MKKKKKPGQKEAEYGIYAGLIGLALGIGLVWTDTYMAAGFIAADILGIAGIVFENKSEIKGYKGRRKTAGKISSWICVLYGAFMTFVWIVSTDPIYSGA